MKEIAKNVGYDVEKSDGIMVPGGTLCNLTAFLTARHHKFPKLRDEGVGDIRAVVFGSEQAHYSIERSLMVGGIGMKNFIKVKADLNG